MSGNDRLLILDNYDSFTYNLAQYLADLGAQVEVVRNDRITVDEVRKQGFSRLIISPGPGRPESSGICLELVKALGPEVPILGVCLGHQAIGVAMGGNLIRGTHPVHGKVSKIHHDGKTIFSGVVSPLVGGRYHSLILERDSLPDCLEVSAETEDGLVMGIRHRDYPLEGVQFHPESVLTGEGKKILANFIESSIEEETSVGTIKEIFRVGDQP